jgi:hypothetical protein
LIRDGLTMQSFGGFILAAIEPCRWLEENREWIVGSVQPGVVLEEVSNRVQQAGGNQKQREMSNKIEVNMCLNRRKSFGRRRAILGVVTEGGFPGRHCAGRNRQRVLTSWRKSSTQ